MTANPVGFLSQQSHSLPGIRRVLLYFAIGIAIGFGYAKVAHVALMFGLINGITITVLVGLFEIFLKQTAVGGRIRRARFVFYSLFVLSIWIILILTSLEGVTHFLARFGIDTGDPLRHQARQVLFTDMVAAVIIIYSVHALARIKSLVGTRNLIRLLFGSYRRPLWECKVFLFIDIVNSTGITQELGSRRALALFTEFFSDIDEPISRYGGEPHRYIGDEIVVTWPLKDVDNAIEALRAIAFKIENTADRYIKHHGVAPKFRAGLHGGEIVSGKVGSEKKREIVYFGDTINTASRLTGLATELGVDVLASEQLVNYLKKPYPELKPLGEFPLKGLTEPLRVYGLDLSVWGSQRKSYLFGRSAPTI